MLIYKIMTQTHWSEFRKHGRFTGAPVDLADGFIHFSTAAQLRETAAKHFAGQDGLMLIWGESTDLGPDLRWEPSRGGADFPHLYRDWMLHEVIDACDLTLQNGVHIFPAAIPDSAS